MRAAVRQFLFAAGAVVVSASALSAQSVVKPFSFGVSAGASMPTGDAGEGLQTGFNVGGLLEVMPAVSPLGLRVEAGYHRFGYDGGIDGNSRLITGIANALYKFQGTTVRPYVIGGLGVYNGGGEVAGMKLDSETKFGLNGGAGIDLPLTGISTFIEARYHTVFTEETNFNMFPVTVGVRF